MLETLKIDHTSFSLNCFMKISYDFLWQLRNFLRKLCKNKKKQKTSRLRGDFTIFRVGRGYADTTFVVVGLIELYVFIEVFLHDKYLSVIQNLQAFQISRNFICRWLLTGLPVRKHEWAWKLSKIVQFVQKNLNIWPEKSENKLPGPEFRLLPENWHPCSDIRIQWKLGITRSLGPRNFVCYIRYFVRLVNKQYKLKEINSLGPEKLVCYIRPLYIKLELLPVTK